VFPKFSLPPLSLSIWLWFVPGTRISGQYDLTLRATNRTRMFFGGARFVYSWRTSCTPVLVWLFQVGSGVSEFLPRELCFGEERWGFWLVGGRVEFRWVQFYYRLREINGIWRAIWIVCVVLRLWVGVSHVWVFSELKSVFLVIFCGDLKVFFMAI
jgi:hypothetical protein